MAPRVLALVTLPPPPGGPEISNSILFKGLEGVELLRVNPPGTQAERGIVSARKLLWFLKTYLKFLGKLPRRRVLYLGVTSTRHGWLRDLAFIVPAKLLGRELVLHVRGGHFHLFLAEAGPLRPLIRWAFKGSRVLVQSPRLRRIVQGLAPDAQVLPNPVPPEAFEVEPNIEGKTILFVGLVSVAKGFNVLAEAMRQVWRAHPDARLLILGSVPKRETNVFWDAESTERLPERDLSGLLGELLATGKVEHHQGVLGAGKWQLFQRASVFVLPSRSEGVPMSVMEALGSGLPVVASRVGGIPDVVRDGVEGFLVKPGDPEELARALIKLLGDPNLRLKMSKAARARAEEFRPSAVRETLKRMLGIFTH